MLKPYKNNTEYLMKGPNQCNHTIQLLEKGLNHDMIDYDINAYYDCGMPHGFMHYNLLYNSESEAETYEYEVIKRQ